MEKSSRAQNNNYSHQTTTTKTTDKSLSLKELVTNSSTKDCEIFFVTKRRNFDVIVDTITKSYNKFVIKKSHKI